MPKPKASYPWDFFDEIELNRVRCRICSIQFNKKTSNQQNHLKRHHKISRPENHPNAGGKSVNDETLSLSNVPTTTKSNPNNFVYNLLCSIQNNKNLADHVANVSDEMATGEDINDENYGQEECENGNCYGSNDTNTSTENSASVYTEDLPIENFNNQNNSGNGDDAQISRVESSQGINFFIEMDVSL